MSVLIFKKLSIISDREKTAAVFEFGRRFNLILGTNNSVGKSTLVKSLFWAFGCDPRFDDDWLAIDPKVCLEFSVGQDNCIIARHGNRIRLSVGGDSFLDFSSITGPYADTFSRLVNFHVRLESRDADSIVTPPPAYYFLPFYIDQKQSWANAWTGFDRLGQFSRWQKEVIPYHVGIFNKSYFDLSSSIFDVREKKKTAQNEISRMDSAVAIVNEFSPTTEALLDESLLDELKEKVAEDAFEAHNQQERLLSQLASLRAELAYIDSQLSIARSAVNALNKDYKFALNQDDDLICPTCGVHHDNSFVSRFDLLADIDRAEEAVFRLENQRTKTLEKISDCTAAFDKVKEKIQKICTKFGERDDGLVVSGADAINALAANSVKKKVLKQRAAQADALVSWQKEESALAKQRTSISKKSKQVVSEKFSTLFSIYTSKLRAFGVNTASVAAPDNYSKLAKSGGAAESTRAMLAYYVAIFNLIGEFSEETLSPFVIDTPNQHEQAAAHYESIVKLLMEDIPTTSQVFLCGMDSPRLEPMKKVSKTFLLSMERSLLRGESYAITRKQVGFLFDEVVSEKQV